MHFTPHRVRRTFNLRDGVAIRRFSLQSDKSATNRLAGMQPAVFHHMMIKSILTLATVFSLVVVGPAFSKTLKLPNEEFAIASITFPDDWEPEEVTNGVAGQSPDTAVYMAAVAVGTEKGMDSELDDTFTMLEEHKVKLDKDSKKESKFDLNGTEVEELLFEGKDEDGPCAVSIAFVPVKDKIVVFTYWVTTSKEKEHQGEVGKILRSLKPAS